MYVESASVTRGGELRSRAAGARTAESSGRGRNGGPVKALADPVRLQLLSSVASRAGGEACVCDISAGVEVSQPTISHHLKVLRDAGLLTSRRRASWVYYAVVPEALTVLSNLLSVHADAAPALGAPA